MPTTPTPEYRVDPDNPGRVVRLVVAQNGTRRWFEQSTRADSLSDADVQGWVRLIPAPTADHACAPPPARDFIAGALGGRRWDCPVDGAAWMLARHMVGRQQQWEWRRMPARLVQAEARATVRDGGA